MIITLSSVKGGVGKSLLAQTLAAFLVKNGRSTLLVDVDAQKTTLEWAESYGKIPFQYIDDDVQRKLMALEAEYEFIVVDSGGHDSSASRQARSASDLVLFATTPRQRALRTAPDFYSLMQKAKIKNSHIRCRAILTMTPTLPSLASRTADAREYLKDCHLEPLKEALANREIYDLTDYHEVSIFDCDNAKAISESNALCSEIMDVIKELSHAEA